MKARTVIVGRGEESLLCDPGSKLRLEKGRKTEGNGNRRAYIINGNKSEEKKNDVEPTYI